MVRKRSPGRISEDWLRLKRALDELYGLGYAHAELEDALYEAVTLEDVKKAANKYLKADALVVAVVEPPAEKQETGKQTQELAI